ncbi:unnamed protein product [Ceratitis capitata]|uniref:(Mediterranean fruit fly) hypothetical protein n=1 Tax=Ceratitis capitata TaxID=7213 RepID=A0A811U5J2_CERCA|nr:unnamed protein product [Ceratitis capitata]
MFEPRGCSAAAVTAVGSTAIVAALSLYGVEKKRKCNWVRMGFVVTDDAATSAPTTLVLPLWFECVTLRSEFGFDYDDDDDDNDNDDGRQSPQKPTHDKLYIPTRARCEKSNKIGVCRRPQVHKKITIRRTNKQINKPTDQATDLDRSRLNEPDDVKKKSRHLKKT